MATKFYAAQLRELRFDELGDSLLQHPDAYEISEVQVGIQAHRMNPRPVAWGYFDTARDAKRAISFSDFPSDRSPAGAELLR